MPDDQAAADINTSKVHVLFLCTGNICRSPLAEAIARDRFNGSYRFTSAGTHAIEGSEAAENSLIVAIERGLDVSEHRASSLENCPQPDVVIGMEQHHLVAARAKFPTLEASRIRLLGHPVGIADPYLHGLDVYRTAIEAIDRGFESLDLGEFFS